MKTPTKTNAARILDGLGIAYEIREYEVNLEEFSAVVVAEKIGLPPEQVFKTLLCVTSHPNDQRPSGAPRSDREHVFAVVPGDAELDFKKLAAAAGARKAEMVSLKDVQPLTGYVRGGVTVFGAKKDFPVYVDETIELFDGVSVSAGTRGVQVVLKPEDYIRAAKATSADLTKDVRAQERLV
jgi:Cys-tRNA(Pro)/Cys-tRNA(Cys) deacylase